MYSPKDFRVNEAWIAVKANRRPLLIQNALYDCYVLMDAASTFVFSQILVRQGAPPGRQKLLGLIKTAHAKHDVYAKQLVVTAGGPIESIFQELALACGMEAVTIPVNQLLPIIGPMRESFAEVF